MSMRAPQKAAVVRWVSWGLYQPSLTQLLDEVERGRAQGHARESDRRRFVLGVALAKLLVAERHGIDPAGIGLTRSCPDCARPHGRPRLRGLAGEVSITHTDGWTGVALHEFRGVGLDIETCRIWEADALAGIVAAVGTDEEGRAIDRLPPHEASGAFVRLWTRKEAVVKTTGAGLRAPLRDVSVGPLDHDPVIVRQTAGSWGQELLVLAVRAPAGTVASLAVSGSEPVVVDVADVSAAWLHRDLPGRSAR